MNFYFYNTKTSKKELFQPQDSNQVKIYSCGPTVYNFAHIGNIRSFLFVDVLRRSLKLAGYKLNQTMNITDIDDKIIRESVAKGISVEEFTKPWTEAFFTDLASLNIEPVEHYPKATESIPDMISIVHKLNENGMAYEKDGSIYYSIQKFKNYGKLSKIDVSGMKSGVRYDADEYEKEDVRDFVLWKNRKTEDEKSWVSDLGIGRPGWHLECSAMIRKIYDSGIDIHTGGIDLLFPHHENEVALSEGAFPSENFVGTWLHCEHLLVDSEKMSKSKGNFYTLRDILEKGYNVKQIRYHLISAHYRSKLNFSFKQLEESKLALDRIQGTLNRVMESCEFDWPKIDEKNSKVLKDSLQSEFSKKYFSEFQEGIVDDLNLPKALATIFDFTREINIGLDQNKFVKSDLIEIIYTFQLFNVILGLLEFDNPANQLDQTLILEVNQLIEERILAKKNKNFELADRIRKDLMERGIQLLDNKDGSTSWKKNQ
ncbi:MAG: cysteine--tRNA ligase [Leptospira sp.]|nr:cysteine--tRNA ligase [Leptospira sp.]